MNLLGLILLAALSGGIVAVSLRLRASASSAAMWIDSYRLPEGEGQSRARSADEGRPDWLRGGFRAQRESGPLSFRRGSAQKLIAGRRASVWDSPAN